MGESAPRALPRSLLPSGGFRDPRSQHLAKRLQKRTCALGPHPARQCARRSQRHGKVVDLSAFQRDILPLIQEIPLSRLQQATGLSLRYVSLIRRGERTPHPRHWQAFVEAASG